MRVRVLTGSLPFYAIVVACFIPIIQTINQIILTVGKVLKQAMSQLTLPYITSPITRVSNTIPSYKLTLANKLSSSVKTSPSASSCRGKRGVGGGRNAGVHAETHDNGPAYHVTPGGAYRT